MSPPGEFEDFSSYCPHIVFNGVSVGMSCTCSSHSPLLNEVAWLSVSVCAWVCVCVCVCRYVKLSGQKIA